MIHRWRPGAWLRVTGPDAFAFLQGQLTNDLKLLTAQPAVYGLWLNQKGRVLGDSFVVAGATAGEFWVGSYFCPAAELRERLENYIIADDVTVADETSEWSGVTLVGETLMGEIRASRRGLFFPGRRGVGAHLEWLARTPQEIPGDPAVLTPEQMERSRIEAAIPAIPFDIGPGELPYEGGLEVDAISFTKGCYLGQEIVARLKSMGQVRRRLLPVVGVGPRPACPAKLYQGGRQVGELRSTAAADDGVAGLALLTLLHLDRSQPLSLAPGAQPSFRLAVAP
ncbi:MAG TPA: folate-binding protein [Opitutaceae bacterium]|nr:folate-binding protein [Opitutaceae bacterium]